MKHKNMKHAAPGNGIRMVLVLAALLAGRSGAVAKPSARPPNIVFILADDLGWADVGFQCPDGRYRTPAIDRLARDGMVFTRAYAAAPLCTPTRASIVSGQYPARLKMTTAMMHGMYDRPMGFAKTDTYTRKVIQPSARTFLPDEQYTIAEALRDAGYATGFFGKWHMGKNPVAFPENQGFETVFGGGEYPAPPSYFSPYRMAKIPNGPKGEYLTDRLADEVCRYIEQQKGDQPFACFFWHFAVHTPIQAKPETIKRYQGVDPAGHWLDPVYAAMVESLDDSVARVVETLKETGLYDNTIIVFFSDNGGLERSPAGFLVTDNAPLRGGKGMVYEGGVREPCIIRWPGATRAGSVSDEPVTSVDFYPTLLEAAGIQPRQTLDGTSLLPLLRSAGKKPSGREAIYFHFPHYIQTYQSDKLNIEYENRPAAAIIEGDWKLIHFFGEHDELYNLADDIGERNSLAAREPARTAAMREKLFQWLEETDAMVPPPNPAYCPDLRRDGWAGYSDCWTRIANGAMTVHSVGKDPFLFSDRIDVAGPVTFKLRARCSLERGAGAVYWFGDQMRTTGRQGTFFRVANDGQWHEYEVVVNTPERIKRLRLNMGGGQGEWEMDWIRVYRGTGPLARLFYSWEFNGDLAP